ncbi:hypothetical protein KY332_00265 [Candidatus Woesearchaeota archaeon]|nr:hypothetical protein [Candidatus Woesearchaeota archaeon]
MLKKIIDYGKKLIAGGILLAAVGCGAYMPVNKEGPISMGVKAGFECIDYAPKLSKEQRTIPVHDDDGGKAMGDVTTNEPKKLTCAPYLGLEGLVGNEDFKFKFGGEVRFNFPPDNKYDITDDFFDRKLQPLPSPYESYGYSLFETGSKTLEAYLGAEWKFENNILLGLELGFPYSEFRYEKGHYRFSSYEAIEKGRWKGFGKSLNLKIGYSFDDGYYSKELINSINFYYGIEHYPAKFGKDTDILMQTFGLIFEWEF